MIVGCKLPHGLEITHNGETIALNGTNVGFDADNPWRNGAAPDSALRTSGVGLTTLEGGQAAAFVDWFDMSGKGDGPVKSGLIFFTDSKADAGKEAQALEDVEGIEGLDPDKDLPAGLETDNEAPVTTKKK